MLKAIPTTDHLSRLYDELRQIGASCVGLYRNWPYGKPDKIRLLTLAAEMLRYDPRLLTILVTYFLKHFRDINPCAIRGLYTEMETPQAWAVIAEFLKAAADDDEAVYWAEYLQRGLKPVPIQFFYHYIYMPGGELSERAVERGISEYKRWGFLACERPIIDFKSKKTVGSLDRNSRLNLLKKLLNEKKEIRLSDYISALKHSISRQQALTDIKSVPHLIRRGHGRGARWHHAA
jgi:hypothetical protein